MNKIARLKGKDARWATNEDDILNIAADYFKDLFTASDDEDASRIFACVQGRVTSEMNDALLKPFHADEVWLAIKSMTPLKASGNDGYPAIFYHKN